VAALLAAVGLVGHSYNLAKILGDPDDAMRLVLVRDLMGGRGWYDQVITRLQPPAGVVLHWSRLLDGALAMTAKVFGLFLSPDAAEIAMRFLWPLVWTLPALMCALAISRRLGGSLAIFVCAVLFASNQQAFEQFAPGRIDHHNIQIVMTLIAAACAMAKEHRSWWALMAGAATGLGLAIGIEALPFHFLIGTSYAVEAVMGDDDRSTTSNYALSLSGACLLFFCLQTPPWRWSLSFCDAIGLNLVVAIAITSCGLLAISVKRFCLTLRARLLILVAAAAAATGAYLALNPHCIGGPLAAIDPQIRPFWFNIVDEMQPLPIIFKRYRDLGISLAWLTTLMLVTVFFLLTRGWPRRRHADLLAITLVILAVVAGFQAFRMESYVFWLGFPLLAAGTGVVATRLWKGLMVPTVLACVFLSPAGVEALSLAGETIFGSGHGVPQGLVENRCHNTAEFGQLRALPSGLVLADISMGPFILANTKHSILNAPYHRMSFGILAAHDALTMKSVEAEDKFHELKIDYLVYCQMKSAQAVPRSVEWDLSRGQVPSWLEPLSDKAATLQVYLVRS